MNNLYSMTGYASVEFDTPAGKLLLEVRTVNHKGLDIRVQGVRALELQHKIEGWLRDRFRRGRVNLQVHAADAKSTMPASTEQLSQALNQLRAELESLQQDGALQILPGAEWQLNQVLKNIEPQDSLDIPQTRIDELCVLLNQDRLREGALLADELLRIATEIETLALQVEAERDEEEKRIQVQWRERMEQLLAEFSQADAGRLAGELAGLIVRGDIREELVRLRAHTGRLQELLTGSHTATGHQLEILGQEMLREANTLCSKVQSTAAKETGMAIRVLADQFREQIANVE